MVETSDSDEQQADDGATAAAVSLALGEAGSNQSLSPDAQTFLQKQSRYLDLQMEDLHEQRDLTLSHLKWRRFNDRMRGLWVLSLAGIGILALLAFGAALWSAHSANGIVVEAFSVPPDFGSKGLTGEVVAKKVLDKLAEFQAQTATSRASSSYANNWGDDFKVQIPETGISVSDFNRALRSWLGHETRISGEIYRTPSEIAVTARAGSEASPVFTGKEANLDQLIQRAAEAIYRDTQPFRYAVYLAQHGRTIESETVYRFLIATGTPVERAWGYVGLGALAANNGNFAQAITLNRAAIVAKPDLPLSYGNISDYENELQHEELSFAAAKQAISIANRGADPSMQTESVAVSVLSDEAAIAQDEGDFLKYQSLIREFISLPDRNDALTNGVRHDLHACGMLHDEACLNAGVASFLPATTPYQILSQQGPLNSSELALHHWRKVVRISSIVLPELRRIGPAGKRYIVFLHNPTRALAAANLADFKTAHALIDTTPLDCAVCLRDRGWIDALEKNWRGSAYWFGRAVAAAPSLPFAYCDWGETLLQKGDFDRAIAMFAAANQKGPHFADPLEGWGESLIAKNRSDLAIDKFEEADKYAPNWPRLHAKWGEALWYSGRQDDAKKQFKVAASLNLESKNGL